MSLHPTVSWAQRKDLIFLTVEVMDITNPVIDVKPDRIHFKAKGEKEQNEYEFEIEFYKEVDVEKSKQNLTPRKLSLVLYKKKDEEEYWPKLQKGGKLNFLKVDFAKWRDEDDEDEEEGQDDPMGGMDFSQLMSQAGGNMPGMPGGMANMPNFADDAAMESSSDEEEEEDDTKASGSK
ncbi:HSP20-like chaperone [Syncephalastrum racemosum]|uniref:HSP20-like chaperone n=1 Tax=Syncephalastrum racemosum TaxID=13706 RepID=A0A1X2HJV9_SYNRA|nr:HSP20-like chaperone [Syncephalastrum racemosum]